MPNAALSFLHRRIWQRLPQRARRFMLLHGTAAVAPRATPGAKMAMPIIIVGLLHQASGLGAAARACHDALRCAELSVYGVDLTRTLVQEAECPDFPFVDGRKLAGPGTVFLHVSGPLVPLALAALGRAFVRDKRIIAHWFWELPCVPREWHLGLPFVHEIFVNTRFCAEAFRRMAGGRPVHIVPFPLPTPHSQPRQLGGKTDRPFTVLVVFNVASNFARKNPCAAIRAFRLAFGDDPSVRLIVKYSNAAVWPESVPLMRQAADGARNIVFNGDMISAAGMDALYHAADVVLSLHRAEGLALIIAEAMLRGLPVVATNWSGNTDFLTRDTGIPIGYDLIPVEDPQGNYDGIDALWADPHIEEAAAALQTLRADPALRERLGAAARAEAARLFHPARYANEVKRLLDLSDL